MTRTQRIYWAKAALIAGAIPVVIFASASGPELGRSGVPGEQTCIDGCHTGTLNSGSGGVAVTFSGGGSTFTPGEKQRLTVTVSDPTMRTWGFQATARQTGAAKTQAGTFANVDSGTTIGCASSSLVQQTYDVTSCPSSQPLMYINHSQAKNGSGSASWSIDWTAPDMDSVTFYVTGNAANGNGQNTGDRIYSKTYTLTKSAGGGGAKPVISSNAVTNGASFQPGITGGSWVTIKGTNLANIAAAGRTWRAEEIVNNRLPTSLDGVSVTIDSKPAFVYFISPTQINVVAPTDIGAGTVSVVVTNNGQASDPAPAVAQDFSPAFFQYNTTWAIATRHPDGALVGDPAKVPGTVQVKPGDVIILWGTGFGPTTPAIPNGQVITGAPTVNTNPTVTIGGSPAPLAGAAMSPGSAGLYQIAVTVPNVGDGDQEVVATAGGLSSPRGVTISVKR
jgi:uncharacterized protein (TIGR03437 family)